MPQASSSAPSKKRSAWRRRGRSRCPTRSSNLTGWQRAPSQRGGVELVDLVQRGRLAGQAEDHHRHQLIGAKRRLSRGDRRLPRNCSDTKNRARARHPVVEVAVKAGRGAPARDRSPRHRRGTSAPSSTGAAPGSNAARCCCRVPPLDEVARIVLLDRHEHAHDVAATNGCRSWRHAVEEHRPAQRRLDEGGSSRRRACRA